MDMRLVRLVRRFLPKPIFSRLRPWFNLHSRLRVLEDSQVQMATYLSRQSYLRGNDSQSINRHELKVYSQNGEDGILLYLFSKIDSTNRFAVEFGVGDATECNSLNLLVNWGWRGTLLDCDTEKTRTAHSFLERKLNGRSSDVVVVNSLITRENIDELLIEHCPETGPDLLSIDTDGNDYWLWKSLSRLRPRVVVIEYNAAFGAERTIAVPYELLFDRYQKHPSGLCFGASLKALEKLGEEKGYALVGCDSNGVNAFFVRRDVARGRIKALPSEVCYRPLAPRHSPLTSKEQFALIRHLEYHEV